MSNKDNNEYKFVPPFRVGKKNSIAILDANGREVALFAKGAEEEAQAYCNLLSRVNNDKKEPRNVRLC